MEEIFGQKCMICGGVFDENSDIAVCPECGTPFHRACYKKAGHCVNTALHEANAVWQPDGKSEKAAAHETATCKRCGKENKPNAFFCESCGFPRDSFIKTEDPGEREKLKEELGDTDEEEIFYGNGVDGIIMRPMREHKGDPLCGFNPEEVFDEDVTMSEIAEYVKYNTHYYLPVFKNIKRFGTPIVWNFTALLFPELYFAYRKMPLYAIGALLLRLFLAIPDLIIICDALTATMPGFAEYTSWATAFDVTSQNFQILRLIFSVADFCRMWFFASKANVIYYNNVIENIRFLRILYKQRDEYPEYFEGIDDFNGLLKKKGGTSIFALTFFIILFLVPYAFIVISQF
jgi:ribosomal protein L37E